MTLLPNESDPPQSCGLLSRRNGDDAVAPPEIRLVAIDLDGTLLTDSKDVSDRTAEALRCLPAQGVRTVIASARPPRSVRHIYAKLGLDTWTINYNGALIWDEHARRVVFHQPMECEVVREIIDRSRAAFPELLVGCEVLDRWFTDRDEQTYTTETGRLFRPDGVMPLDAFCNQPITKLLLLGEPALLRTIEPVFYDYPQVIAVRADPELIQVMDRRASKAAALRLVASHYRVPMGQVMAIGDAANDVAMLEAAGVAVAMDNAHSSVKDVAHWVAPSNNDHGVHAALVRYGLCT
jgi:Cof subfamily protein (haloacid dehalogenase superfamily)